MGGFCLLVHEHQKTISDLAERWEGIPIGAEDFVFPACPDASVKASEAVQSYCRIRRGTLDEIRCAIEKYEPRRACDPRYMDPSGFNLIALHKYPLVNLEGNRTHCLYYQGLSASLLHRRRPVSERRHWLAGNSETMSGSECLTRMSFRMVYSLYLSASDCRITRSPELRETRSIWRASQSLASTRNPNGC